MKKSRPRKGEAQKASPLYFDSILIEKLVVGGAGIGRLPDGRVVFVPRTVPGDLVRIEVTQTKKNFAEANLVEIQSPSSKRIVPPCPVASDCGGCSWQQVQHQEQLDQKQLILTDLMNKFLKSAAIQPEPIVSSPKAFHYRNRIQPKVRNGKVGFFAKNSHQLVETDACLIAEEPLSQIMSRLPALINEPTADLEVFLDSHEQVQWRKLDTPTDGVGFSQVNRFQNQQLIEFVCSSVKDKSYSQIFDLYAGAGNFTFPLARIHPKTPLTAVELSEKLVRRGIEQNSFHQIQFVTSDVGHFLKRAKVPKNSLVVLDPPRAGCGIDAMKDLLTYQPRDIVYISCHPASLVRDLQAILFDRDGQRTAYRLTKVQAFEMFPQTDHFETIAVLSVDTNPLNVTF